MNGTNRNIWIKYVRKVSRNALGFLMMKNHDLVCLNIYAARNPKIKPRSPCFEVRTDTRVTKVSCMEIDFFALL
jgi:hypothetical protein